MIRWITSSLCRTMATEAFAYPSRPNPRWPLGLIGLRRRRPLIEPGASSATPEGSKGLVGSGCDPGFPSSSAHSKSQPGPALPGWLGLGVVHPWGLIALQPTGPGSRLVRKRSFITSLAVDFSAQAPLSERPSVVRSESPDHHFGDDRSSSGKSGRRRSKLERSDRNGDLAIRRLLDREVDRF